jgi:putative peptide zinc metalloprotease protein
VLAMVKIVHELGHAVACRHFGGDCHEIGLMLLVFTPSLYCNVTDSWMLKSKWRRIAIAGAGMYVELILASTCTLLWWFSAPGLANSLFLNTLLVCSVGTILFNGNPLLRYDGYFIFADLVEVPNLRAEATAAAQCLLARWCLGMQLEPAGRMTSARQRWLVAYAVASTLYRWFVVVVVLWGLHLLAREYRLEALVAPLVALTLIGLVWPMAFAATGFLRTPGAWRRVAPARIAASVIVVASVIVAALIVPLPRRVSAPLMVEYRDADRVYATVPGRLHAEVKTGQRVDKGQVLARLSNPEVTLEVARLRGERDQQRLFLKNLESQRLQGSMDGSQVPSATAMLADLEKRLEQLERDAAELTLVAPRSGCVLPPPIIPVEHANTDALPRWSGTPLDEPNEASYLERGTQLCLVGDPNRFEAILHVDQADVELVQDGQRVRMALDSLPGETYWGAVVDVARLDLKVMPRELAAAGDLPARTDERGATRPLDTWYQVRVRFDQDPPRLVARVHGRAKIVVAPLSLASQLARYLKQTFGR